jgi:hypothetical protein
METPADDAGAVPAGASQQPALTRAWAQRLLAAEAASRSTPDRDAREVVLVCEKLRISLAQSVGADGFTALLRRALALARSDIPSLRTVKVAADGRLEGLDEFAAAVPGDGVEAATAIATHLLSLLVTFIGVSLTLRLLHEAWPSTSLDE